MDGVWKTPSSLLLPSLTLQVPAKGSSLVRPRVSGSLITEGPCLLLRSAAFPGIRLSVILTYVVHLT